MIVRAQPLLQLLLLAACTVYAAALLPQPPHSHSQHGGHRRSRMRLLDTNRLHISRPFALAPPRTATLRSYQDVGGNHNMLDLDAAQLLELDQMQEYNIHSSDLLEPHYEQLPDLLHGVLREPSLLPVPAPIPSPAGFDQKLELSLGPCVLQINEPCTDSGNIIFYLFSSVDGRPAVLSVDDPQLPETFDPGLPTKVLIHGFAGSVDFNFTASIRQAYLLRGGYNVLVVDWGRLTQLPCYPSSVLNTWQVARCTGQLLSQLGQLTPSLQPPSLHVLGFSLGAHIAAYLSSELQARTGQRVARITGLDPALPAFASLSSSWKLDASDADFVDVVHTNSGVLGKVEPTGHVDFYVNGGSIQPFCMTGNRNIPLCSHLLAPVYFSETILDETSHWGRQCPSYGHYAWGWCPSPPPGQLVSIPGAFMGEGIDPMIRGTFLVETGAQYPFALGPPISQPPHATDTFFVFLS